ncbi:flagellin [Candidatus Bathyarchaeota archaeon]|nr:flagellin [Candidatus Bathyarchaeota archaeon]
MRILIIFILNDRSGIKPTRRTNMKIYKDRRGMTGLETAIILVAFVITAAAFAFVVLNMGFLTAQKSQTVISAGMQEASSSLQADGDIIGIMDTTNKNMTSCEFYIRLSQGKEPVDINESKLIVTYANPYQHGVVYSDASTDAVNITEIVGDADGLVEGGERWKVVIDFSAVGALDDFTADGSEYTSEYEQFRIELRPATGSVLTIERTLPAIHEDVMVIE